MVRFFCALVLLVTPAAAAATLPGPYGAEVLRVLDGDSFEARVRIWLDQDVTVTVRIAGIDTAEMDAPCETARVMARLAKAALAARLARGGVTISDIARDKYGGRVLARAADATGADIGPMLLAAGLARPYEGGRANWCPAT